MNKLYSVHDHWTNINKKNDVDIESIDGVITGIKVNGEDYGGSISWEQVFTGDVVTSGETAPFSGTINANLSGSDTIKVVYNNTEYILPKQVTDYGIFYGAPAAENPGNIDFSEIPFIIDWGEVSTLYTQSAGPQNITILEPQSGGGESDFSTAEVTVNNTTENFIQGRKVQVYDTPISGVVPSNSFQIGSRSCIVPLYKGTCYWYFTESANVSVSGDIEWDSEKREVRISGNGTITIS